MGTEKMLLGKINQVECPNGAQVSRIDSSVVKPEELLDETVHIAYADGKSVPKC